MLIYYVGVYDSEKKDISTILFLPERRQDPKRTAKRYLDNWVKSIMGVEWWGKNWAKVSIIKNRRDSLKGETIDQN